MAVQRLRKLEAAELAKRSFTLLVHAVGSGVLFRCTGGPDLRKILCARLEDGKRKYVDLCPTSFLPSASMSDVSYRVSLTPGKKMTTDEAKRILGLEKSAGSLLFVFVR